MDTSYFLLVLFFFFSCCAAQSDDPVYSTCNGTPLPTAGSRSVAALLPRLVSGTIQNGYIATTQGAGAAQVYGLAQCRGDVDASTCSSCIAAAARRISESCPNRTDARIWYDYCFLRYSTAAFFGQVDTSGLYLYNVVNVTDSASFNKKLEALVKKISSEAIKPQSRGLGRERTDLSEFVWLYALAQCTRDLSPLSCAQCVSIAVSNFATICADRRGCRVVYTSCYVRYEEYPFYFPLDAQSSDHNLNSIGSYKQITAYENTET